MNRFLRALSERILILDCAVGRMLPARELASGASPEELNLQQPDLIETLHRKVVAAGAEIIGGNTLGGNRPKLTRHGLESRLREVNRAGVEIARRVAGTKRFVAAAIGPTERLPLPHGSGGFDEMLAIFREQIEACAAAGPDLISFETFSDIRELRAAVIAARQCCVLPLMALMTFGESGPAEFATSPEAAAVTLDALGVDVLGISSGLGIDDSRDLLTKIRRVTNRPLVARLNAGPPEEMTAGIPQLIDLGVRVIGGCCGSNPLPMPTPAGLAQPWQPPARRCFLSSRTQVIEAGGNSPCRVIGERINPTGKQGYSDELRRGETIFVRREAREQVAAGAELLDINCWVPGVAEPAALERTILAVGEVTDVPLVLDSTSAEALESGLKTADGKVLINSVSGEEKSLRTILPLAKQYGAAIVALALDDSGLPKTAQGRFEVAEKILTAALEIGLPREDVIVDCLALPVSVGQGQVMETLQALRLVRDELGLATLLGVSNISFGLPRRPALTSVFFAMALEAGLKAAIINPKEERIMDTLQSARVLLGEDLRGET